MNHPRRRRLLGAGLAGIVLSLFELVLIRLTIPLGITLVLVSILLGILLAQGGSRLRWAGAAAVVGAVAQIVNLVTGWYPAGVAAQVAVLIAAFTAFLVGFRRSANPGVRSLPRRIVRGVAASAAVAAGLLSATLVALTISPMPVVNALQSAAGYGNSFDSAAPSERTVMADGTLRITDVEYGSRYPNSFLDIYIADGDRTVVRPTYVYVHGGGFFLGSKSEGDPAAGSTNGIATIADPMLAAGYNVVFVDYALVPAVEYPTPTRQVAEAVAFLQSEGADYGIDTRQVVLAGASAGASIVGQISAVETNPDYAAEVGIEPVMHDNLLAVVLDSGPLDPWRAGYTQSPNLLFDYLFELSGRAYYGTAAEARNELNLIGQADENYPAAFISDGNTSTFEDQSQDMHDRLDELGVVNSLDLYPVSEAVLGHGYMAVPSPSTDDYNERKVAFLDTVLER